MWLFLCHSPQRLNYLAFEDSIIVNKALNKSLQLCSLLLIYDGSERIVNKALK